MASSWSDDLRGGTDENKINRGNEETKKVAPVSFGFSRTVSKFKTTNSSQNEAEKEERDYLTGVEGKELRSTKHSEKPKDLIIPLITKNRWQTPHRAAQTAGEAKADTVSEDSVESQAVRELIEESLRQQEKWKNGPQSDNICIPLLMQNKVPQGFEDGDTVKVDLRPESSTDADYERVPVEAYGMAMLKGMGWKEGEGIGRTFKQDVKPIEHQLRPKGLGLGADRSALKDLEPSGPRRPPKPGEQRPQQEEEIMVLGPGGCVIMESGPYRNHYGKIEGVDPDNARVMVKLAIGGKTVTISQYTMRLVTRKEYEKNAKDLSRHSKAYREKEQEKKAKESKRGDYREEQKQQQSAHEKQERTDSKRDREQRKRKHPEPSHTSGLNEKPRQTTTPSWLHRDLRVRFVDKFFKGGKYYLSKMTVEDVVTPEVCVCRTEEGRLLDDVKQMMLETIVPKNDSDTIMVVHGEHRGQVGRILHRDKERCRAVVQLDRQEVQTLDYDAICHYVGADY